MATLKRNGTELARFEYADCTVVVMSNGRVLKSCGFGWKCFRKAKPGVTALQIVQRRSESFNRRRAACPAWAKYVELLRSVCGLLVNRARLHQLISLMPGDPDGVWSSMEDCGLPVDLGDVVRLCGWYSVGLKERAAFEAREQGVE